MSTRSFLFSSLPNDIVLNILARLPRRYHPILSCVSQELRSLESSSELRKTRSLLGKDCFYVRFIELHYGQFSPYHWFTLTEDRRLVSIPFPSLPEPCFTAATVGHDIYFVSRSMSMWILDSRSGTLREGPSLLVACDIAAVGLVNDNICIFGASVDKIYQDIQAQVFDLKTQTWQIAPNPNSMKAQW
ncbi:unnamed protein product [Arabis nemorensis]|uniref:F-box domain-containing protein n=1 Tax=Arabis nemorensis TaxID=586526 RepID=A0A565BYD2_9BRAS|nr:unnamed protein product [Arabis nemorensis]